MNLHSLSQPQDAPHRADRRIVAVASGKGGVGKTWFAITLAQALAARGRRALLFDGDLGLANIDIQLGLMPEIDLQSVFTGRVPLAEAVFGYEQGGFDVVSGSSGVGGLASLAPDRLDALGDNVIELAARYDRVLIDLGAGIETTVRRLARPAATIIVITTEEPTSLTDAYAFIKLTKRDTPETDLRIVVNMATSRPAGEHAYRTISKACQNFLKFTPALAGIIRRDGRVPDCIRHQTPLLSRFPNSDAAEDVAAIARHLIDSS